MACFVLWFGFMYHVCRRGLFRGVLVFGVFSIDVSYFTEYKLGFGLEPDVAKITVVRMRFEAWTMSPC